MNNMTIVNSCGIDEGVIHTTTGPVLPPSNVMPNPIIIHDNNRSEQEPAQLQSDRFTSTLFHETAEWKEKQKKIRQENAEVYQLRLQLPMINAENERLKKQIEKILSKSLSSG